MEGEPDGGGTRWRGTREPDSVDVTKGRGPGRKGYQAGWREPGSVGCDGGKTRWRGTR